MTPLDPKLWAYLVAVGQEPEPELPWGQRAVLDDGQYAAVPDATAPPVELWVCPLLADGHPPYAVGTCAECGAAISYRPNPRALSFTDAKTRKVCPPCAVAISKATP